MGKIGLIILGVIVVIGLIIGGVMFGSYNTLVTKQQNVKAQWSLVENQMQRRADLIPNIVATVKGIAGLEERVFTKIAEARSQLLSTMQNPNSTTEDKIAAHGDNLASIVLYGSVAAGDHISEHSDHNLLIALNRIASEDLRLAQSALRDWLKSGQPPPVYFTVEELKRAADVFPIEFLQMEKA